MGVHPEPNDRNIPLRGNSLETCSKQHDNCRVLLVFNIKIVGKKKTGTSHRDGLQSDLPRRSIHASIPSFQTMFLDMQASSSHLEPPGIRVQLGYVYDS